MRTQSARYPKLLTLIAIAFVTASFTSASTVFSRPPRAKSLLVRAVNSKTKRVGPPRTLLDRKNATLVAVFTTTCEPCNYEVPMFNRISADVKARGVLVVGVSVDGKRPGVLFPWMKKFKVSYPVYYAMQAIRSGRSVLGDVSTLPSTVLISREGTVLRRWTGIVPERILRAAISPLLRPQPSKKK